MKKYLVAVGLLTSLGLFPLALAQDQEGLFDTKKSTQDLEVMKGILRTTLELLYKDLDGQGSNRKSSSFFRGSWGFSTIKAYYLYGQGAVFTIPSSTITNTFLVKRGAGYALSGDEAIELAFGEVQIAETEAQLAAAEASLLALGKSSGSGVGGYVGGKPGYVGSGERPSPTPPQPPVPEEPPVPPSPPAPPSPPLVGSGTAPQAESAPRRARDRLHVLQERVKQRKEATEQRRIKYQKILGRLRTQLIETLANHGDSLTQVKPGEYITFIITRESRAGSPAQILSVQKSKITQYKTGKLTYEQFKQSVLAYTN